jgi:hypothetical protein
MLSLIGRLRRSFVPVAEYRAVRPDHPARTAVFLAFGNERGSR